MGHKNDKAKTSADDNSNELPDKILDDAIGFVDMEDATAAVGPEDALKAELDKAKNDYLYLRAEFDNYRKQAIKERSELVRYSGEKLARDLLDTLDIFDTALASEVTPENVDVFIKGIQLTAQQLRGTLAKHGINEVPAKGAPFDPFTHEALGSEPTKDTPVGHISQVFKKPYKFHDKILRPGQVIVASAIDKES